MVFAASEFTYAEQISKQPVTYLNMNPGESVDLCFIGVPDYKNYGCHWESSNESVAKVDQMGVVTAVADGSAKISLTIGDGTKYTSKPVQVMVSGMTVTAGTKEDHAISFAELAIGECIDFNFYGIRDWSSRRTQYLTEWDSSDNSIAFVNQKDGVVTALSKGTAIIIFRIYDMEKDILLHSAPVTLTVN